MGRRAVLECIDHPTKPFAHFVFVVSRNFKGFEHDFRAVVPNRARDQLITVARQIILIAQHIQRIALQRVHSALRHRKWVVFKIDLACFLVFLVDREIHDPGKGKTISICQAKLFADNGARTPCNTFESLWLAAKEKGRIAQTKA